MDLKLLKTFYTVYETGSFSSAGEKLNYAQSSVSEQIKKLENWVQGELFSRSGKEISLTEKGMKLLPYAEEILHLCSEAESVMLSSGEIEGTLRIGITETLCLHKFPSILQKYRRLYPKVNIQLILGSCYVFHPWLKDNKIDAALMLDDRDFASEDTESYTLFHENLVLVSGNIPRFQNHDSESSDLSQETFIYTPKGSRYRAIFEDYLKRNHVVPKSILEFESSAVIKNFVKNDMGIAMLPKFTVSHDIANGHLKEHAINENLSIPCQMIHRRSKWTPPALDAFINMILDSHMM